MTRAKLETSLAYTSHRQTKGAPELHTNRASRFDKKGHFDCASSLHHAHIAARNSSRHRLRQQMLQAMRLPTLHLFWDFLYCCPQQGGAGPGVRARPAGCRGACNTAYAAVAVIQDALWCRCAIVRRPSVISTARARDRRNALVTWRRGHQMSCYHHRGTCRYHRHRRAAHHHTAQISSFSESFASIYMLANNCVARRTHDAAK